MAVRQLLCGRPSPAKNACWRRVRRVLTSRRLESGGEECQRVLCIRPGGRREFRVDEGLLDLSTKTTEDSQAALLVRVVRFVRTRIPRGTTGTNHRRRENTRQTLKPSSTTEHGSALEHQSSVDLFYRIFRGANPLVPAGPRTIQGGSSSLRVSSGLCSTRWRSGARRPAARQPATPGTQA